MKYSDEWRLHGSLGNFSLPSNDKTQNEQNVCSGDRQRVGQHTQGTKMILEEIALSCETCMVLSRPSQFLRETAPPDKIFFNEEVSIDLMWLEGNATLHDVDCQKHFNSAYQLKGHIVEDLSESLVKCSLSFYTGYPHNLRVDKGSAFKYIRLQRLFDMVGTEPHPSGVEYHHALDSFEHYHSPIRHVYLKLRH